MSNNKSIAMYLNERIIEELRFNVNKNLAYKPQSMFLDNVNRNNGLSTLIDNMQKWHKTLNFSHEIDQKLFPVTSSVLCATVVQTPFGIFEIDDAQKEQFEETLRKHIVIFGREIYNQYISRNTKKPLRINKIETEISNQKFEILKHDLENYILTKGEYFVRGLSPNDEQAFHKSFDDWLQNIICSILEGNTNVIDTQRIYGTYYRTDKGIIDITPEVKGSMIFYLESERETYKSYLLERRKYFARKPNSLARR